MKDVRNLLKDLFKPEASTDKRDARIYAKLLEKDIQDLEDRNRKLQKLVVEMSDALSVHACSIHANDDPAEALWRRMGRARDAAAAFDKQLKEQDISRWNFKV